MRKRKIYTPEQLEEAQDICQRDMHPINSEWLVCLGQSDNSKDVLFVLYRWSLADSMFATGQNPMKYQGPLSGDIVKACLKARQICGKLNINLEADSNNERANVTFMKKYFLKENEDFIKKLKKYSKKNHIIEDMDFRFERKGELSERQIEFANTIFDQVDEREKELRNRKRRQNIISKKEGLFFEPNEKVEVFVKKIIDGYEFEGNFGTTFVEKYLTKCGKIVMYKGGTPPSLYNEKADTFQDVTKMTIKGTVKHNSYINREGVKIEQTQLQRIKIIN